MLLLNEKKYYIQFRFMKNLLHANFFQLSCVIFPIGYKSFEKKKITKYLENL